MALIGSVNNLAIGKGGGDVANNTAVGTSSLGSNTTGYNNSAVGQGSLSSTTTGIQNTAIGRNAGSFNTTGSYNTFVGDVTGQSANTATRNTFVGAYSGYFASGERNTFIGMDSGFDITTGTKNTIIGRYTGNQDGLDIRTVSNRIVLSDGDGNPRVYIDNNGALKAAKNGIASSFDATSFHELIGSGANSYELKVLNYNATPLSQYITEISFQSSSPDNSSAKFLQCRDSLHCLR